MRNRIVFGPATLALAIAFLNCRPLLSAEAGDEQWSWLQFDLSGNGLAGFASNVCERDLDVVGCQMGTYLIETALGGQYRIGRHLAAGGLAALAWEPGFETRTVLIWRAALDGRFYPLARKNIEIWISVEAGLVSAHAKIEETTDAAGTTTIKDHQFGPETGLGLGVDFALGERFSLGCSTHALWLIFGASEQDGLGSALELDRAIWVSLGLQLNFRSFI